MLYFGYMKSARDLWPGWAEFLQKRGMGGLAAWWLEAAGPLHVITAQLLHAGEPFFSENQRYGVQELAATLDDPDQTQALAEILRGQTRRC